MPKFIIVHYEEDPEAIMKFLSTARFLWNDHVIYIRNAITSILENLDDINFIAVRLDKNQEDIGQLLAPYYGDAAALRLTTMLKEHIAIATDIVRYKKAARDTAELETKWDENIMAIAEFLATLDPSNWPQSAIYAALKEHLTHTMSAINARIEKNYDAEIGIFDLLRSSALVIADAMANGIVDKFPEKFVKYDL